MSIQNLRKIFEPECVAVIGASEVPGKVGYSVLRNLIRQGYAGEVYAINAKRELVQGLKSYHDLSELPRAPDLAIICTPAPTVAGLIRQCGETGVGGVVVLSAGFRETGSAGYELEKCVRAEAARFPGLRIIGPNCLGLMVPTKRLNASFAADMPPAGNLAFISQSGALCTAVLDWAKTKHVGFSHFVSVGNMLDVDLGDLLDYFAADPSTSAVMLYVESVSDARSFMSAARAFSREKPIIAYKAGRFAESAQAAASHTGAMAGVDKVYEAAFRRAGIIRVFDVDELFDCAELLSKQRQLPAGQRLAILTNAGGPGVMASDALLAASGTLSHLVPQTIAQLDPCLPNSWSHSNPVDILGDATAERYAQSLEIVLTASEVDAVLVVLTPQAMTEPTATATAVAAAAKKFQKPVLASWMGQNSVQAGVERLNDAGIATFTTPERAVRAFMHLVAYTRLRDVLYETPRDIPLNFNLDRSKIHRPVVPTGLAGQAILSEAESKDLLAAYGISTATPLAASSADEAVSIAQSIGYPVVLKILSPQITHKTDVGGVVTNLAHESEVRAAFRQIVEKVHQKCPDATIQGVTVQPMIDRNDGLELIVGSKRDPVFGPVIMVGMGGVTAELFKMHALELPPLNERLAFRMLESLPIWPLVKGYRGRPPLAADRLVETLMRFSFLVAELPEIEEIDINPLFVTSQDVIALDARVVLNQSSSHGQTSQHAHLAICPYPERFVSKRTLPGGQQIILRPLHPEDEPQWLKLLSRCSPETMFDRFRYLPKAVTHEMARRFCYLDYDREMALVAEIEQAGKCELIGVGRLIAGADRDSAEFAVLVVDDWQGRGVGTVLTDACLEVARDWQLKTVFGETSRENLRMLRLFRAFDFDLHFDDGADTVRAERVPGLGAALQEVGTSQPAIPHP